MDEWTPEDEFDPCYCTMCRKHIPRTLSARQGVCPDCAKKRTALAKTETTVAKPGGKLAKASSSVPAKVSPYDTHIGVCRSCGSRNLAIEGWDSPIQDALVRGVEKSFIGRLGRAVLPGAEPGGQGGQGGQGGGQDWSRLHIEPDTIVRCRDCANRWKWKDR